MSTSTDLDFNVKMWDGYNWNYFNGDIQIYSGDNSGSQSVTSGVGSSDPPSIQKACIIQYSGSVTIPANLKC